MNKFVQFFGSFVAIVVVGVLIMTATGQLGPVLRSDSAISDNALDVSEPGTMVTPDGRFSVLKTGDTYFVTENSPASKQQVASAKGTPLAGDLLDGGTPMNPAAAVTCNPGIVTKGPQDPASKKYKISCPTSMPGDSYFQAPAITELQNALGCTNAAAAAANVACPDATNCEKDGTPTMQTPNPFTTCTVKNKRRDARAKTCTADVDCTAAQCDYKQLCKPKPRETCCYADSQTVATCRAGAGTCSAGETVGTDYPTGGQCGMNCKPVNTRCCKPATGAWSCSPTCAAGVTGEIKTIAECGGMCSSSPTVYCCKNTAANTYGCKTSCGTGETSQTITGMCDPATNCKASSSSSTPAVCCKNSNGQFYCRQSCNTNEVGVGITGACNANSGGNCTQSSSSSATSTPVSVCCLTAGTYTCSPNCAGTVVPFTGNNGVCDTNINCKSSASSSSTPPPPPPPPPPSSTGSTSSRCTGSTPVGTTCSNSNPCDTSKGDCFCSTTGNPLAITGKCQ